MNDLGADPAVTGMRCALFRVVWNDRTTACTICAYLVVIYQPKEENAVQQSDSARRPDYPIEQIFYQRWSPRSFSDEIMTETELLTALEAARWAPSSYNFQPWRLLYSLNGDRWWQRYVETLEPFNKIWAQRARALVYILSDTQAPGPDGTSEDAGTASLDAGAAWSHFALQAHSMGLSCRGIAGFNVHKVRETLHVPVRFKVEMAVAIGRIGRKDDLPEKLRNQENPSHRRPLNQSAFAGGFPEEHS